MASQHNSICEETGFTANDDAEYNAMAGWMDATLLSGVREELNFNHDVDLEYGEIEAIMAEEGIDFGYEGDLSVADLIWDSLETDDGLT